MLFFACEIRFGLVDCAVLVFRCLVIPVGNVVFRRLMGLFSF